uniref:(California timema) hypothetical protein n=1 Tax=Timema californicum TaxID=61474 RepID=A0A7R9P2L5_TIMCA|nr:unnamed protein product [Timema californicum]
MPLPVDRTLFAALFKRTCSCFSTCAYAARWEEFGYPSLPPTLTRVGGLWHRDCTVGSRCSRGSDCPISTDSCACHANNARCEHNTGNWWKEGLGGWGVNTHGPLYRRDEMIIVGFHYTAPSVIITQSNDTTLAAETVRHTFIPSERLPTDMKGHGFNPRLGTEFKAIHTNGVGMREVKLEEMRPLLCVGKVGNNLVENTSIKPKSGWDLIPSLHATGAFGHCSLALTNARRLLHAYSHQNPSSVDTHIKYEDHLVWFTGVWEVLIRHVLYAIHHYAYYHCVSQAVYDRLLWKRRLPDDVILTHRTNRIVIRVPELLSSLTMPDVYDADSRPDVSDTSNHRALYSLRLPPGVFSVPRVPSAYPSVVTSPEKERERKTHMFLFLEGHPVARVFIHKTVLCWLGGRREGVGSLKGEGGWPRGVACSQSIIISCLKSARRSTCQQVLLPRPRRTEQLLACDVGRPGNDAHMYIDWETYAVMGIKAMKSFSRPRVDKNIVLHSIALSRTHLPPPYPVVGSDSIVYLSSKVVQALNISVPSLYNVLDPAKVTLLLRAVLQIAVRLSG